MTRRFQALFIAGPCLLFFALSSAAQQAGLYADSIRAFLLKTPPDTGKYYLLLRLAQLPECPPDTLLAYGRRYQVWAARQGMDTSQPEAFYAIGLAMFRKGENKAAIDYLYRAAGSWEKNGRNPLQLARTYELIAAIYKTLQRFADALTYYRQAYQLKKTQHNEASLLSTYNGLGNTFRLLKNADSAVFYLTRALALATAANNELARAQVTNNLGNIYWENHDYVPADKWYHEALTHFEALHSAQGMAESYFNLGTVAVSRKQYKDAVGYFNKSLQSAYKGEPLEHREWVYQYLADAYALDHDFENAYKTHVLYDTIRDSAFSLSMQRSIAELKEKYETAKKEQALAIEKERTARLSVINSNNVRLIYGLAAVAVVISLLGYFMLRNMRRKQLLAQQVATLKEKEHKQLLREQDLKNNIAMLEGQDAERQRISRDLHDRLGSTLTTVKLFVQSSRADPGGAADYARKIDLLIEEAVDDIRGISHDMSLGILQKYGLVEALRDLKETAEATGVLHVSLNLQDAGKLSSPAATEIYYILKELVHNAVKHSKSTELSIQFLAENELLYLTVEDNGSGFDHTTVSRGIGLSNIETRVHKINAQYTIDTYPGKGACFFFKIPLG